MTTPGTPLEEHLRAQLEAGQRFFWQRLRCEAVEREMPTRAATVVDVGAGTGILGHFLRDRRPDVRYRFVEPIDFLETELEREFGGDANARREPVFDGADVVCLLDVLEHQEDDIAFLRELSGRMPPGSRLVITVPALRALWSRWDDLLGHHRRYTRSTLRAAAVGLPLAEERVAYLFPEMLAPALARKAAARLRGRRDTDNGGGAEFPDLPPRVNDALYRLGRLTARRNWPAGTSVMGVWTRR